MNKKSKLFGLFTLILFGTLSFTSCSDDDDNTYSYDSEKAVTLTTHNWATVKILDEQELDVNLTDSIVQPYVGFSYFKSNGDFRTVNLDDVTEAFGTWGIIGNSSTLHLDVFNQSNTKNTVEIITLADTAFTYRVRYDANDNSKYIDVTQIPTNHVEPIIPATILGSKIWDATNVYDVTSFYHGTKENPIDMSALDGQALADAIANLTPLSNDTLPAKAYMGETNYGFTSGSSYFPQIDVENTTIYSNGTFNFYEKNDPTVTLSQGNWYVSLDGKYRTLYTVNNNKVVENKVSIGTLTSTSFIYYIVDGDQVLRVENTTK